MLTQFIFTSSYSIPQITNYLDLNVLYILMGFLISSFSEYVLSKWYGFRFMDLCVRLYSKFCFIIMCRIVTPLHNELLQWTAWFTVSRIYPEVNGTDSVASTDDAFLDFFFFKQWQTYAIKHSNKSLFISSRLFIYSGCSKSVWKVLCLNPLDVISEIFGMFQKGTLSPRFTVFICQQKRNSKSKKRELLWMNH